MQAEKDPAASFAPTPQTSTSQRALTEAAEQSEDKIEEVADAAERQIMASTRKAREEWRSLQKAVGHMWTALLQQELQTSDGWTTTALRTCERLFRLGFVKKQYASIPILAPTSLLASLEVALSPKFDVEAQAATQELGNFLNSVVSGSLTDKDVAQVDAAIDAVCSNPDLHAVLTSLTVDSAPGLEVALHSLISLHPDHAEILRAWLKNLKLHWNAAYGLIAVRLISARCASDTEAIPVATS
eukprot:INCI14986.6.p1 GENE.INCI14986.6~~INCI14986.6.p1  ORF type:complete len:243 (-),score=40.16 INCI14986.6:51-779(-)